MADRPGRPNVPGEKLLVQIRSEEPAALVRRALARLREATGDYTTGDAIARAQIFQVFATLNPRAITKGIRSGKANKKQRNRPRATVARKKTTKKARKEETK